MDVRKWNYGLPYMKYVSEHFIQDRCAVIASALTLTSLFALVPLMAVVLGVFSAFSGFAQLGSQVQEFVFRNFVPTSSEIIQQYLHDFVKQAQGLQLLGIIFLIVTALLLMTTIDRAFNTIWRVRARRSWLRVFLLYWAILTLGPLLVGFSLGLTSYFASLPIFSDAASQVGAWTHIFLPFFLTWFALTLLYISVPDRRVPVVDALVGGIFAAILFELAKRGFTLYVTWFPAYRLIFGALATIPFFLLWIYVSWIIVLLGAEVSHGISAYRSNSGNEEGSAFALVIHVLAQCYQYHKAGRSVTRRELLNAFPGFSDVQLEQTLSEMEEIGILGLLADGSFVLQQDLKTITLAQLYNILPWPLPKKEEMSEFPKITGLLAQANETLDQVLSVSIAGLLGEKEAMQD